MHFCTGTDVVLFYFILFYITLIPRVCQCQTLIFSVEQRMGGGGGGGTKISNPGGTCLLWIIDLTRQVARCSLQEKKPNITTSLFYLWLLSHCFFDNKNVPYGPISVPHCHLHVPVNTLLLVHLLP